MAIGSFAHGVVGFFGFCVVRCLWGLAQGMVGFLVFVWCDGCGKLCVGCGEFGWKGVVMDGHHTEFSFV